MKKRIAIVNQRYGEEVNGGSEYYTKQLAEHLALYYEVEVLTTTAKDYDTWAPYYPEGLQIVDGVTVRRFPIRRQRTMAEFKVINKLVQLFPGIHQILEPLWLKAQGPYCPDLIQYIKEQKNEYDTFIFVTYLYYTTAAGMPEVIDKSVFVPTAHDEYCIYFHIYRSLFQKSKSIVYLTEEEKRFVEKLFDNENIPNRVAGSGIDVPDIPDVSGFRKKYEVNSDYIVYVGRIDVGKNCDELFEYFNRFCKTHKQSPELLMVGKLMMEKPENDRIQMLGFISEEDKYAAIAGASVLVMPSAHESLSLVVLEAMALGVPVLANGSCVVLEAHCAKSGAGISYRDYSAFEAGIEMLLGKEEKRYEMGEKGKRYVRDHYSWDETIEKYRELLEG